MLAKVSTLLSTVGLPHRPLTAGNGGRGRGSPRLPSMEAISAVSSPQTNAPAPMRISRSKSKPRAQDVLAEQAVLARLVEGVLEALDGQRVLGADVDVALVRADGVAGDGHALDDAVRVAFEHAAVHERAGVALVGVAEDVLGVVVLLLGEAATSGRWGSRRRRGRAGRTA